MIFRDAGDIRRKLSQFALKTLAAFFVADVLQQKLILD